MTSLSALARHPALKSARLLTAASLRGVELGDAEAHLQDMGASGGVANYAGLRVESLHSIDEVTAAALRQAGVTTVGELARVGDDTDRALIGQAESNGFQERPSAPAELLPGMSGAVASRVRYSSFVRDTELRQLRLEACEDCAEPLALSSVYGKSKATLTDLFTNQKCPVLYLGYLCGHVQEWINLGTHLGEVVHSLALAPGESRNIALVNWRRRQLTALEEHTSTQERLTATFVQNRALSEVTTAVAAEKQSGGTDTEASTAVTAAGFVAAGAVVGGAALGAAGALVGGVVGTLVEPGGGTVIGAVAGGAAGAVVGGAAGAAAGGLVYAGSRALGRIVASSEGDRDIVANLHQQIELSTSQNASAVRSLWSTVVVEDAQAEHVQATTSNITNYNHMHALNIEYYELLQRYLVRIGLERVEPVLYLPFGFADFTGFQYVRDYWEAVRRHIDDDALRAQGDAYFVTEGEPEVPDLLAVPPMPTPPPQPDPPRLAGLKIDLLFDEFLINNDLGLKLKRANGNEISGQRTDDGVPDGDRHGYSHGHRFSFGDVAAAHEIVAVVLTLDQALDDLGLRFDVNYAVRVKSGTRQPGGASLAGRSIESNAVLKGDSQAKSFEIDWRPITNHASATQQQLDDYANKMAQRDAVLAENARRLAAYNALRENIERFKSRLQRLLLRRRHHFTRVLLDAIEPEVVITLLESLCLRGREAGGPVVRLSDIAHTLPMGMYPGGFVLRLKKGNYHLQRLTRLLKDSSLRIEQDLGALLTYAGEIEQDLRDKNAASRSRSSQEVYLPTGGLFAEALLGRSNAAEYIDVERYFNWQDSPIPHQAPAMTAVDTGSRFQDQNVQPTTPQATLAPAAPVALPAPTGMAGVLSAIQNGSMFRDMSKAQELAGIVGNLATLAGQMGQAASTMTGAAATQALQAATQIGQAAADLAGTLGAAAFQQAGAAFSSMGTLTGQGAMLNQAARLDAQRQGGSAAPSASGATSGDLAGGGGPVGGGADGAGAAGGGGTAAGSVTLAEQTFRRLTGTGSGGGGSVMHAVDSGILPDTELGGAIAGPGAWRDLVGYELAPAILDVLQARAMAPQRLSAAASTNINLDYFPVEVTRMPEVAGARLTPTQLLRHVRLHINDFLFSALCEFEPYDDAVDGPVWASDTPVGAVLRIDLGGPDNAAVVCVEAVADHWTFHTVRTPWTETGDHPVSGQRMFGFVEQGAGRFVFFTRGADRATTFFDAAVSEELFNAGAAVWTGWRVRLLEFVLAHGGDAQLLRPMAGRMPWNRVVAELGLPINI